MNILPLVFTLLLLFALASNALFHGLKVSAKTESFYRERIGAEIAARNQWHKLKYESIPKKKEPKPVDPEKTNKGSRKTAKKIAAGYFRDAAPPDCDIARLDIALLLQSPPSTELYKVLHAAACKLIRLLYQGTPCYREGIEQPIVDALLAKARQKPECTDLSLLAPDDPDLLLRFTKMIQGTNCYDLSKKEGYPPLGDYLVIDGQRGRKPLHFYWAPYVVLEACLGESLAKQIASEEKGFSGTSPKRMRREAFDQLLKTHPSQNTLQEIITLHNAKKPYKNRLTIQSSPKKQLQVRKKYE